MDLVVIFTAVVSVAMVQATACCIDPRRSMQVHRQLAFAARSGGGFGSARTSSRNTKTKKNKRKSGLKEVAPLGPSFQSERKENEKTARSDKVLDKWGLPPPSLEDIFPPMPPGTELIPATKEEYTLQEIVQAMKQHIPLTIQETFGEDCVEKNPPTTDGRPPMKLRLLHVSPPVLAIDDFFTPQECLQVQHVAMPPSSKAAELGCSSASKEDTPFQVDSKTFALAQSTRTSTSWFCYYHSVPILLSKARDRLGFPLAQMEEPQIVRYQTGQEFSWHYDQVPMQNKSPHSSNGGQRLATLLVYLNTVPRGGSTIFRDLTDHRGHTLCVQPVQGTALLFFPAFADGTVDDRTLHKGEVAMDCEKRMIQMWIHERSYQAAVPPGNLQEAAVDVVNDRSQALGYIP